MNIFKLFGSIFVDNEEANKSIAKTDKKAESLGKKFLKGAKAVGKFGAALGATAIAGGAALLGIANKTAEATDRIDKMSQKLGLSREGFQEWDFVLSQAGVDIDSMQTGMKTLTQRMGEAIDETGKGADAFKQLGITITEDMSQEDAFNATIEALQNMEDGIRKAEIAQDLFGKSGQELLPLLNSTAESTEELKQKAQDLGLVMGDEAIDAGVQFTDTMDQLKRSFTQAGLGIGTQLIPVAQKLAAWIVDHMPEIQAFTKKAFDVIGAVVTTAIDVFQTYALPVLETMFQWVKDNMPEIQAFFEQVFEQIKVVVNVAVDVFNNFLVPALKVFWELVKTALPVIKVIFKETFDIIKMLVEAAWNIFERFFLPILKTVFQWVSDHMPEIEATFKFVFELIKGYVQFVIDVYTTFFEILGKVYDFVRDTFSGIGDLIMKAFDGVTGFLDGIVEKFNKVKDAVSGAIGKVKDFLGFESDAERAEAVNSGASVSGTRDVQGLARGGETITSGVIKVGESGPEELIVPRGARVKPLTEEQKGNGEKTVEIKNEFNISQLVVREEADIEKVAREMYQMQRATDRGYGYA